MRHTWVSGAWWILACAPEPTAPVVLERSPPVVPLERAERAQSHPALLSDPDGSWWLAADVATERGHSAVVQHLEPDGAALGTPMVVGTSTEGFTTPDLALDPIGRVHVALVADGVVQIHDGATVQLSNGPVGFWTAPDVAFSGDTRAVAWWSGTPAGPTSYYLSDGGPPVALWEADATGSPMALLGIDGAGWAGAMSYRGYGRGDILVWRLQDDGLDIVPVSDDRDGAASRPALAGTPGGPWAVAWRRQTDGQVGQGARIRWLDEHTLEPLGPSRPLGLDPATTNRVELAASDRWVVAVWEESSADGDVVLQLFDRHTQAARTGPLRVHDEVAGQQARPRVAFSHDERALAVAYESGPVDGDAVVVVRRFELTEPPGP